KKQGPKALLKKFRDNSLVLNKTIFAANAPPWTLSAYSDHFIALFVMGRTLATHNHGVTSIFTLK
ncbi:hypothetical protein MNBD_ALPHA12-1827, partial [hydrothermal vent metagenome]